MRDPSEYLLPAVTETISALSLEAEDAAMVKLALHYARTIDQSPKREYTTRWVGPELMKCLESLGASPAARARLRKGDTADLPSPVAGLRVLGS